MRNRATEEARAAAAVTAILPPDYMLSVMRDPAASQKFAFSSRVRVHKVG
jgi:hypothetical protein